MKTFTKISGLSIVLLILLSSAAQPQDFLSTLTTKYERYKSKAPKERVFIIADRDIYAPGEAVWFDAIVYSINAPVISSLSTEVALELLNSELDLVLEDNYKIVSGRAKSHIELPSGLMDGVYYLQGKTHLSSDLVLYKRKIIVKNKILPPFVTTLSYKESEFNPGDVVPIDLEFKNYFNDPEKNVHYIVKFFDGNSLISELEGKTKKDGKALVELKVPGKINSGILTYQITGESSGLSSDLTGILQVMPTDIHLDLYPENGRLINGIQTKVNVFSYYDTGQPLAVEADLLKNGSVIATLTTDKNGFGGFDILPAMGTKYEVKIKKPVVLSKTIQLPEIVEKGVGLQVVGDVSGSVKYKLSSAYIDPRLVYLVGVSDGEIFWFSEHQVEKDLVVDVDLSKARGAIAHFMAVNAAYKIEGEHVLGLEKKSPALAEIGLNGASVAVRSKMTPEVGTNTGFEGEILLTATNSPWILPGINNPHPSIISLPGDAIHEQIVNHYAAAEMRGSFFTTLAKYYVPLEFSLTEALNEGGHFPNATIDEGVAHKQLYIDQFAGKYKVMKEGGVTVHSNFLVDPTFAVSNPEFVEGLEFKKEEKIPAYKQMLEKGNVQIIDVLNTIKPCKVEGNGIVFFSAVSGMNVSKSALLVIDGVPRGYDAALLTGMNPRSIDQIKVSTQAADIMKYSGFNASGVIEVVTKKGEERTKKAPEIDKELEFSAPDYDNGKGSGNDFRSTVFWKACQWKAQAGTCNLDFFNSDLISGVQGCIYYISNESEPIPINFKYEVK